VKRTQRGFAFSGTESSDDAEISGFGAFGDGRDRCEDHGVSASWHVSAVAAAESSNFVGAGSTPRSAFAAVAEFGAFGDLASVRVESIAVEGMVRVKR
jgi:hypothetical protein